MSERQINEFKTKRGTKVGLVEYINGGEGRTLGLLAQDSSVENQEKLQDRMIEVSVKTINGSKEDILKTVKELELSDYLEVIQKCTELFTGLNDQKKTQ